MIVPIDIGQISIYQRHLLDVRLADNSDSKLRKLACMLLSGAAQSNPKFQIASLEMGLVDTLLRMTALGAGTFSLDQEADISTKAFSAISAIIRNFPEAQNALLRQNGLG